MTNIENTTWEVENASLVNANNNKELVTVSQNNLASLEIAYLGTDRKYMYALLGEVFDEGQEVSEGYAKTVKELLKLINNDKIVNKYFQSRVTSPSQEQIDTITMLTVIQ